MKNSNSKKANRTRRRSTRIIWIRPVLIGLENGLMIFGHTILLSSAGVGLKISGDVKKGQVVELYVLICSKWHPIPGKVVYFRKNGKNDSQDLAECGIAFQDPSLGSYLNELTQISHLSDSGQEEGIETI